MTITHLLFFKHINTIQVLALLGGCNNIFKIYSNTI